jgi:hypothetical protein
LRGILSRRLRIGIIGGMGRWRILSGRLEALRRWVSLRRWARRRLEALGRWARRRLETLRRPGRGWEGRFIVARGPRRTRRGGVCIRRALRTLIACERWLAKHRRRSRRGCERLRRAWRRLEVRELARRRSGRGAVRRLEVCLNVTWRSSRGRESRRCALRWGSDIFGRRGYLQVLKRGQIWFKLLRRWWVWMKVLGRWVVLMRILGKTSARWLRDRVKGFSRRLRNRIKSSNRSVMN